MTKEELLDRLAGVDPGWPEWADLTELVRSLDFTPVDDEYLGRFLAAGERLSFALPESPAWAPHWLPDYVAPLYGLQADFYGMAGGYALAFTGERTKPGYVFAGGETDERLGFPSLPVPPDCYPFQHNNSGALFHLNTSLEVLYPDAQRSRLGVLDSLEVFTRKTIRQTVAGRPWFKAYGGLDADILD